MGKFLLKKTETGFVFHLRAVNGETIGISEIYSSEEICRNGIESVVRIAAAAATEDRTLPRRRTLEFPKFEIFKDKNIRYRFRLLDGDGKELLASQPYTAKASCKNGILSVISNAPTAEIVEAG